jgi:predicted GNAT family acetyltransferase
MTIAPQDIRLETGAGRGRYVYTFTDGTQAEMLYVERQPGIVAITHSETPWRHRGQGIAAALVAHAVGDFRAAGKKVLPLCSFARQQFREHTDWADLLAGG